MGRYRRSPQISFLDPGVALQFRPLKPGSFEVRFRDTCDRLLPDSLFDGLYADNGRPAISPSALSRLLLLELRDGCGDRGTVDNLYYDVRWQFMCNLPLDECDIHYSTLSKFRLRLLFGTLDREQIERMKAEGVVLQETPAYGVLRSLLDAAVALKILEPEAVNGIDSTAIFGAAAVQDSYRLMFQGLREAIRAHAKVATPEAHAELLGQLRRSEYVGEREKPDIDWQDAQARRALLSDYLEDTLAILVAGKSLDDPGVNEALAQLAKLVGQDLDLTSGQATLKQGVAPDRQCSVADPQMRHGRKSASKRFNGYKGHATIEPKSELITGVDVTPASVHDGAAAQPLLEETKAPVVVGDNAYSGGEVRERAQDAGVSLLTPTFPAEPFEKDAFSLDEEGRTITCPAGKTAPIAASGRAHFAAKACRACPFVGQCNPKRHGRTVQIHPAEGLQRELRAMARTEEGSAMIRQVRAATERVIGHWVRWGLRQGRYFGTLKTGLQAVLAAIGHNLDKIGRHLERQADRGVGNSSPKVRQRRAQGPRAGAIAWLVQRIPGYTLSLQFTHV
jgi:IS5 family transposase